MVLPRLLLTVITILLSTANGENFIGYGNYVKIRTLLDCGSQTTYISQKCFNKLGLKRFYHSVFIYGLGNMTKHTSNGCVMCSIKAIGKNNPCITVNAVILEKLCPDMPTFNLQNKNLWSHIVGLVLPDEHFNEPQLLT